MSKYKRVKKIPVKIKEIKKPKKNDKEKDLEGEVAQSEFESFTDFMFTGSGINISPTLQSTPTRGQAPTQIRPSASATTSSSGSGGAGNTTRIYESTSQGEYVAAGTAGDNQPVYERAETATQSRANASPIIRQESNFSSQGIGARPGAPTQGNQLGPASQGQAVDPSRDYSLKDRSENLKVKRDFHRM